MGRAPCCDKANVKRGPWSPEEDATLKSYVESHGTGGNWIALPRKAGLSLSLSLSVTLWSVIASQLPGRTDNDVKNYWNTKLRKKMIAGKINLTTSTSSSQATPINHATALPASSTSIVPPCFPKTETHDSAFPNLQTQNSAVSNLTDNINHGYSQRVSFNPYLCNPRFMDFSEFGTSTTTCNNSPINVNYSSSQEGSSISDSPAIGDHKHCTESMQPGGGNVCEEDAGILMEFGFGLPYYDIVNGIPFEEKASEIACMSLADCTSVSSIIPHGLNQSVINYY
ncbi:hypothetical protein FEM48_Zijuj06G0048800 [Ziziphus jujuba var. spinosa]|uniref:Transcription factor RAX2-like n=1 Tax=Ziziphus jujuba var. spinosa TaxID=714518 RepID=A0A978V799_ZIZJJ|nr:hypothetical protein FEM48_Zijuj06G0048800 [Ziziphus jujuba var. spinosa]